MWKSVELEVTKACNSKCIHCIASAGEKRQYEFNSDELDCILKQLKEKDFKEIIVTGGEPFMREDIFKIMNSIKEYGFEIILNTN
ncbi:unnamed protein product, partial [marine sediment metagenome]